MGFFDKFKISKLREGLQKSHDEFVRKINRIFYKSRKIDDELMAEIEETLLLSDVGVATTERIMAHLVEEMQFKKWSEASQLRDELRKQLSEAIYNGQPPPNPRLGKSGRILTNYLQSRMSLW